MFTQVVDGAVGGASCQDALHVRFVRYRIGVRNFLTVVYSFFLTS